MKTSRAVTLSIVALLIGIAATVFYYQGFIDLDYVASRISAGEASVIPVNKIPTVQQTILDCDSMIAPNISQIETYCKSEYKRFIFTKPAPLEALELYYPAYPTNVYIYDDGSYKIGLIDKVSEKIYDVELWQLPE